MEPKEIEMLARIAHEVNRVHCEHMGDDSQPSWNDAPEWQKDSAMEGVRKIWSGQVTTPEQSHESWLALKVADGWVYGETKDPEKKTHPCMVPYNELPHDQRIKDAFFFAIVKAGMDTYFGR